MAALNRLSRLLLVMLLIASGGAGTTKATEPLKLAEDGWYNWRVASVDEFEEAQFFVQMKSGEPRKIRIVGKRCNSWVWNGWHIDRSNRDMPDSTDLGSIDTDISIDWFEQHIGKPTDLSSDALAAISQHEGPRALQIMIDIVESDAPMDVREEAVFWMALSGSDDAFAYIDRLLMLE